MSELSDPESLPDYKLLPSKTPTKPSPPQPILPSSPPVSPFYGFDSIESISDEEIIAQTDPMQQPLPHCALLPVPPVLDRAHGDGVPPNTDHQSDATSVSKPSLIPRPLLPFSQSSSPSPVSPGQQLTKGGSNFGLKEFAYFKRHEFKVIELLYRGLANEWILKWGGSATNRVTLGCSQGCF